MSDQHYENIYSRLTEHEREVLQLILEGQSNALIALNLYITINTVKMHISNIINKLNDDGNEPPSSASVPRKPLPNGDGNASEELNSLLAERLL
jgi:DNA-binding CsgD family transcriptional regulator